MAFEMTPASLKKICKEAGMYTSLPELNDVLHLQCKGITDIKSLDAYTGLRTLYLECNVISDIQGLDRLAELSTLYLNQNMITDIKGLGSLSKLQTLDLSENMISKLENLSCLPALRQLNLASNRLHDADSIMELKACPSLTSLDISKNHLEDQAALEVLTSLPLTFLRLVGNPVVSNTAHYRKHMLTAMPQLNYLDDRPAFDEDRRAAVAFSQGGLEAERAMREAIRLEKAAEQERHRKAFDDMLEAAKARMAAAREEAARMAPDVEAAASLAGAAQSAARDAADLAAGLARVVRELGEAAEAEWAQEVARRRQEEARREQERVEQQGREERERLWRARLQQVKDAAATKQQQDQAEHGGHAAASVTAVGTQQGAALGHDTAPVRDMDEMGEPLAVEQVLARARADAAQFGWAKRSTCDRDCYGRAPRWRDAGCVDACDDDEDSSSTSRGSSSSSSGSSSDSSEGLRNGRPREGQASPYLGRRARMVGDENRAAVMEDLRAAGDNDQQRQRPREDGEGDQQVLDQHRHRVTSAFRDELQARVGARNVVSATGNGGVRAEPSWMVVNGSVTAAESAGERQRARPLIWGTSRYASLWTAAVGLGERREEEQQQRLQGGRGQREQSSDEDGPGEGLPQGARQQGDERDGQRQGVEQRQHLGNGVDPGWGEEDEERQDGDVEEVVAHGGMRGNGVGNGLGGTGDMENGGTSDRPPVRVAWGGQQGAGNGHVVELASEGGMRGENGHAGSRDVMHGPAPGQHLTANGGSNRMNGAIGAGNGVAMGAGSGEHPSTVGHADGDDRPVFAGMGRTEGRREDARQLAPGFSGHACMREGESPCGRGMNGLSNHRDAADETSLPLPVARTASSGYAVSSRAVNSLGGHADISADGLDRPGADAHGIQQAWQLPSGVHDAGEDAASGVGSAGSDERRQGVLENEVYFEELD